MAEKLSIPTATLSKYKSYISFDSCKLITIKKLAKVFNISPNDFVGLLDKYSEERELAVIEEFGELVNFNTPIYTCTLFYINMEPRSIAFILQDVFTGKKVFMIGIN